MRKERLLNIGFWVGLILLLVTIALAATAGSGWTPYSSERQSRGMSKIILAMKAEGGTYDQQTDEFYTGQLVSVMIRSASTPNNFLDAYDITIMGEHGQDLTKGGGVNYSPFADAIISGTTMGWVVGERIRVNVINAGANRLATAYIYIRNEY